MPYFEPSWDVLSKTTKIVPNALTYKLQHLDLETSTLDRGIEAGNCTLKGIIIHALKDKSGPVLNSLRRRVVLGLPTALETTATNLLSD